MKNVRSPLILIVMLGSFCSFPAFTQTLSDDSASARNLRAEFDSCVVTARKHWAKGDKRLALKHSLSALDIAVKSDSIYDDLMTLRMVGRIYWAIHAPDSAEHYLNELLIKADTIENVDVMKGYTLLGNICVHRGNYDKALQYHFSALELAKIVDPDFVHGPLHNIGFTYYKLLDYERSIAYSEQALQQKEGSKVTDGLEDNLLNLGLAHLNLSRYDKAAFYVDSAFSLCKQTPCDPQTWAHANLAKGMVSYEKGNYHEAKSFLSESLRVSEETGNIRYRLDAIEILSKTLIADGELEDARTLLIKGAEFIQTDSSAAPDASDIYLGLARVYALTKQYEAAFKYKQLAEKIVENVAMRKQTARLMRVEGARIEREYKQRLEDRDRLLALQAGMVSKQRALNIVLGIAAVLAAALAFVLWRGLLRKKRIAQMLDRVVQSRTREIIERVRLASRAQEETAIRTSKARAELNLFFANLKQMCTLAAAEPTTSPIHDYLKVLSKSADETAGHVGMLLSPPAAYETENGYGEQSMF